MLRTDLVGNYPLSPTFGRCSTSDAHLVQLFGTVGTSTETSYVDKLQCIGQAVSADREEVSLEYIRIDLEDYYGIQSPSSENGRVNYTDGL